MSELTTDIKKVRVQCRRGMLELDFLFERFLQNKYLTLSSPQQAAFMRLLTYSDPQLLAWFIKAEIPEDLELAGMVAMIASCD